MWEGRPEKSRDPWRDTGIEIVGPAIAHAERAFAESWRLAGGTIGDDEMPADDGMFPAGTVNLRLIPRAVYGEHAARRSARCRDGAA